MSCDIIKIENFGPIRDGEVDISKPMVFMGSNSSGKSFTALLIHTLLNPFSIEDYTDREKYYEIGINSFKHLSNNNYNLLKKYVDEFDNYVSSKPNLKSNPFIIKKKIMKY